MGKKYFTLSFDDGLEQDKKIIALMKKYALKGTFNLNAGLFGNRGEVKGIGTFAFQDLEQGAKHVWPFSYVPHNRIPKSEILEVYKGMEIASHSYGHEALGRIPADKMKESIDRDLKELTELTGQKIAGHAYASGSTSEETMNYLKEKGILYARGAFPGNSLEFPDNPLYFNPSNAVASSKTMHLIEQFKKAEAGDKDLLLFLWGHGYEFDYGKKYHNWEFLEQVFDAIAGQDDIVYCTNQGAFLHI